jgi:hypothetical protein
MFLNGFLDVNGCLKLTVLNVDEYVGVGRVF